MINTHAILCLILISDEKVNVSIESGAPLDGANEVASLIKESYLSLAIVCFAVNAFRKVNV